MDTIQKLSPLNRSIIEKRSIQKKQHTIKEHQKLYLIQIKY